MRFIALSSQFAGPAGSGPDRYALLASRFRRTRSAAGWRPQPSGFDRLRQ